VAPERVSRCRLDISGPTAVFRRNARRAGCSSRSADHPVSQATFREQQGFCCEHMCALVTPGVEFLDLKATHVSVFFELTIPRSQGLAFAGAG
jgi:hypothetical protein